MKRVALMGELAASLSHEIMQPIAAAVMNAEACIRWLRHDAPDVTEARNAASAMAAAATRAISIIDRVRLLYRRGTSGRELVDLNEVIREVTAVLWNTARRNSISIRTELDGGLLPTTADRVLLQQV